MTNEENKDSINESLKKELVTTGLDLSIDYSEIPIDGLINKRIAEEIPIVKTIVALGKIGLTIREIHFSRKILGFIKEFHTSELSPNKLEEFKQRMDSDSKYKCKVTDHLLIILDRIITEQKAIYLAKLFNAHINGIYTWDTFVDLTICLDTMQMIDFKIIKYLHTNGLSKIEDIILPETNKCVVSASIERLKTYGFIGEDQYTWEALKDTFKKKVCITEFGNYFYDSCYN